MNWINWPYLYRLYLTFLVPVIDLWLATGIFTFALWVVARWGYSGYSFMQLWGVVIAVAVLSRVVAIGWGRRSY